MDTCCPNCFHPRQDTGASCPICRFSPERDERHAWPPVGSLLGERFQIGRLLGDGQHAPCACLALDLQASPPARVRLERCGEFPTVSLYQSSTLHGPQDSSLFLPDPHTNLNVANERVGTEDGQHFIVSPFVDGCPLSTYIERHGAVSEAAAIAIGLAVLDVLHLLEIKHQPHGEIEAGDVFFRYPGHIVLQSTRPSAAEHGAPLKSVGRLLAYLLSGASPIGDATALACSQPLQKVIAAAGDGQTYPDADTFRKALSALAVGTDKALAKPPSQPQAAKKTAPWRWIALAGGLLVVLSAAFYFLRNGDHGEQRPTPAPPAGHSQSTTVQPPAAEGTPPALPNLPPPPAGNADPRTPPLSGELDPASPAPLKQARTPNAKQPPQSSPQAKRGAKDADEIEKCNWNLCK